MKVTKRHRPQTGLALLGLLGAAVFAGGTLWLQTGWHSVGLTLKAQLCNGTPLDGFTLSGALGWNGSYDRLRFTLTDGTLQTGQRLDDPDAIAASRQQGEVLVSQTYALPPEQRAAVDEAAVANLPALDGNRQVNGTTDTVRLMYTLELPGATQLRISAGDVALETPITATATELYPQDDVSYHDYACWPDADDPVWDSWPGSPVSSHPFVLGAGYGVCWTQDTLGRAPGLYRAEGLTQPEISELPADGTVHGYPVVCNSTEYGTLTPFYCPDDASRALLGASMADGSTLLVYLDGGNTLCADLVNAAGTRTDHRTFDTFGQIARVNAWLMPRTDNRDAAVWVETFDQQSDEFLYSSTLPVTLMLRAENGRFTVAESVPDKDHLYPAAALLNEAGDRVLFACDNTIYQDGLPTVLGDNGRGIDLRVYDLDGARLQYWGTLTTGAERDWRYDTYLKRTDIPREIYFDSLQEDGGTWK